MNNSLFDVIEASADSMGACEPRWLKERQEPEFSVSRFGDSGPHMLLLHGLFGAMSNWDSTIPLMAEYSRPYAFGFPLLSGHRSEVKVKALAAYTEYYIRKNFDHPVVLCGNSLGGHVAMRLYLASPELVDCFILSGTSGLYEHSVDSLPVRMGEKFIREHLAKVFFNQDFVTDEAVEEVRIILESRMNTLNLIHAARSAKKDNLLHRLKEIKIPTLLLWGEDDTVTTMDVAETFRDNISGSKLVTIKDCGHAPMIEHPEWFAEEVKMFLEEHSQQ
ncbi:MAG: alpha/beta hydrolase [Bdellovibrionales bacterium]|nr:alpha/beta hydrolase [Bdellovibrionales bacterium]